MAVTKEILTQYVDLQEEAKETRDKIERLETQISQLEKRITEIENGETVKDKVRGGAGGLQSFQIEGIPTVEYQNKTSELMLKKLLLNQRKSTLEIQEFELLQKTNQVEEFIHSLTDSHMRRIINLRIIEKLPWGKVAEKIGGGNTEDSVKKIFYRFMEK